MRQPLIAPLLLALASSAALADPDAVRRCRALPVDKARLACYDAIVLPAAAVGGEAALAAARGVPASRFGFSETPDIPERVESRIVGRFEGWNPRDHIRLANGQVWQVADDSRGVYWLDSPRAVVRRGALGSFVLEIEGARSFVRVRRVE
jgi:hypothetical protein